MATREEREARLRELNDKRAARTAQLEDERLDHELLVAELREKYSSELGVEGRAFAIVNEANAVGAGPFVVRPPMLLAQKMWSTAGKEALTPEVSQAFVKPCVVYPTPEKAQLVFNERHQVTLMCATALTKLSGFVEEDEVKKS